MLQAARQLRVPRWVLHLGLGRLWAQGSCPKTVPKDRARKDARKVCPKMFDRKSVHPHLWAQLLGSPFLRALGTALGTALGAAVGRGFGRGFGRSFGRSFGRGFGRNFGRGFGRSFGRGFGRSFGRGFGLSSGRGSGRICGRSARHSPTYRNMQA